MRKASVHGPNRRRNRVGDSTVASNPLLDQTKPLDEQNSNDAISFRVKSLEEHQAKSHLLDSLAGRHACLVACGGPAGQALLQKHQQQVSHEKNNGGETQDYPILVHFHDMAVLVLRVIPIMEETENVLYLSEVHRHNHKVCEDFVYPVTCCSRPSSDYDEISAVHVEVSLRHHDDDDDKENDIPHTTVSAKEIAKRLMSATYQCVLTQHELLLITIPSDGDDDDDDVDLVCRIAEIRVAKDFSNQEDESSAALSMAEATMDDPFRGRVVVDTDFYVTTSPGAMQSLTIIGQRPFPEGRLPTDVIHVTTRDGEWFPVRRLLLAPCIKLTHCVQAGRGKYKDDVPRLSDEERSEDAPTNDGCPHCKVDTDCHTFDRVLLYLTSLLYPKPQQFLPELSEINALADAAESLGLQSLVDLCRAQVSTFDSRVRKDSYIHLSEVEARNHKGGELLLILDGMVLDITRWLDEHPGGPFIIPTQALNVDCTVFFEMYHVSRQAFIYLKSFYIGELRPEDYTTLQQRSGGDNVTASEGFLQSLRSYTKEWRVQISEGEAEKIHKSL